MSLSIMAPNSVEVTYKENYAVLYMKNGENRLNVNFLKELNAALDDIERYLVAVWSIFCHLLVFKCCDEVLTIL